MIPDEEITYYLNLYHLEAEIKWHEDAILTILKLFHEKHPSDKSNENWLKYSDFIATRRGL